MTLNKNTLILGLICVLAVVFFYKDWEVGKWQSKYETEAQMPPDTVKITLDLRDTTFTDTADSSDIITETSGDTVFVYKTLYDEVKQPLFTLRTTVNSKTEKFTYDFIYKPLTIQLTFADKYDLQKGFEVATIPDVGKVIVDWGDYTPLKPKKDIKISVGLGYSKSIGPALLSGIQWKKNEIGVIMTGPTKDREGSVGFYFKRAFFSF